jgi:transcriptional regulator with PAS, ATPase and Fis domain
VGKTRLQLADRWMSTEHAQVRPMFGRWLLEDGGSKNGTFVNGQAVKRAELRDGDILELGRNLFVFREHSTSALWSELEPQTLHANYAERLTALRGIAVSAVTVVLHGETGTGKEVVARAIHRGSARKGEFVAVNCGALPATLAESELFGYRKGAFSGAIEDRPGLVRASSGGTLFLDEIGDLPYALQTTLLRVLQEREIVPLGAARPVSVNLRVIAASHRNLERLVAAGSFRADLLARLSGFVLSLPPLRERREDLGLLVASILRRHAGRAAERLTIAPGVTRALALHRWPHNVRELEKALEAAIALSAGSRIEVEHLPQAVRDAPVDAPPLIDSASPVLGPRDIARKTQLLGLLLDNGGNVTAVARSLGKARAQVQRWLKRYGINSGSFR